MSSRKVTTSWAEQRARATLLFSAEPWAADDRAIGDVFASHPDAVVALITAVGEAFRAGKVHTPWRVLVSKLPALEQDNQPVELGLRPLACPECGVGRGWHAVDCPLAPSNQEP